jgi:hypothetical protein
MAGRARRLAAGLLLAGLLLLLAAPAVPSDGLLPPQPIPTPWKTTAPPEESHASPSAASPSAAAPGSDAVGGSKSVAVVAGGAAVIVIAALSLVGLRRVASGSPGNGPADGPSGGEDEG